MKLYAGKKAWWLSWMLFFLCCGMTRATGQNELTDKEPRRMEEGVVLATSDRFQVIDMEHSAGLLERNRDEGVLLDAENGDAGFRTTEGVFLGAKKGNGEIPGVQCVAADIFGFQGGTYVWQRPVPAVATGMMLLVGSSPLYLSDMQKYNLLIREESQYFRRNSFSHKAITIDNYLQFLPLCSLVALNAVGIESRHGLGSLALRGGSGIIISSLIVHTLKGTIEFWRPDRGSSNSFPSGHTSFAFCGAELLRLEYGQTTPLIPIIGYGIATLTGGLRIFNDRHWASDVLFGIATGVVSANLAAWINDYISGRLNSRKKFVSERGTFLY